MDKFKFKKKYGQNFLQDENILKKISACVELTNKDLIVEIGPGKGALTKYLKINGSQVLCYEIDEDTKPYLSKLEDEKTKIIYGDFLKADITSDISNYSYDNLYIIANLPYYITTPIIQKIIDSEINPKTMILMVQKEVADRFNAKPRTKAYNSLTVFLNYHFNINTEFLVGRKSFYPVPNVDSAIISMKMKENKLYLKNLDNLDRILKMSFVQKRKTLKNNLGSELFNKVLPLLLENGYTEQVRAEEITLEVFVDMANII